MNPRTSDPLLNALDFFGQLYGTTVNPASAVDGLPLANGKLTPELFSRAAGRCGLEAKLVKRSFRQLNDVLLPAIVLTKSGPPCLLASRGKSECEVIALDGSGRSETVARRDVAADYSGYVILVKLAFDFEKRSDFSEDEPRRSKSWFWGTLWRFRSLYAKVGFATIFINIFAVTSSVFVMNVYDRVIPNKAMDTLYVLAIGAAIAYGCDFLIKMLRTFFLDRAGHRADLIMSGYLYENIMGMKYASRPASAGALGAQARSYEGLREFFASATITTLVDLPFVFVFAGVVYMLGGVVAVPMVIGMLIALLVGFIMQWPIYNAAKKGYQAGNQRQAQNVETINALETIKTVGAESTLAKKMEAAVYESAKADSRSKMLSQGTVNFTALITHMVSIAVVIVAVYQVNQENMTMGAMIACVLLAGRGMAPVGQFANLLVRLQQSRLSLKGLQDLMRKPVDRAQDSLGLDLGVFTPSIKVQSASFSFPVSEDQSLDVLQDVSFELKAGDRVGILGKIGSGKSTLIRMMMGLYDPSSGSVEISGVDIRQLNPSQYRRKIGYVSQDAGLLYGTLRYNLTVGAPWVGEEGVWLAIQRAGLEELVQAHPSGIDIPIAEGGASLSGGQRQLVALARALIEEPDILIFDEPTSAMDPGSERMFRERVAAYLAEDATRMLIMATHKSSMLELVDRLLVIDGGKLINDGSKDQVLVRGDGAQVASGAVDPANSVSTTPDSGAGSPSAKSVTPSKKLVQKQGVHAKSTPSKV